MDLHVVKLRTISMIEDRMLSMNDFDDDRVLYGAHLMPTP